jgi:acetate kinase
MTDVVLVLNAGSSSIKFTLFDAAGAGPPLLLGGQIEGLYTSPKFGAVDARGADIGSKSWGEGTQLGHEGALTHLAEFLRTHGQGHHLVAVGHRVVHGGTDYTGAVRVTPQVITALDKLTPLAPLHQPHNLAPLRIL